MCTVGRTSGMKRKLLQGKEGPWPHAAFVRRGKKRTERFPELGTARAATGSWDGSPRQIAQAVGKNLLSFWCGISGLVTWGVIMAQPPSEGDLPTHHPPRQLAKDAARLVGSFEAALLLLLLSFSPDS